jgi:hypothetical protein
MWTQAPKYKHLLIHSIYAIMFSEVAASGRTVVEIIFDRSEKVFSKVS